MLIQFHGIVRFNAIILTPNIKFRKIKNKNEKKNT